MKTKQGRNDPCACGSGLKFKKCCGDSPSPAPQRTSTDDDLRDRRYLLQLDWPEFSAEFSRRIGQFLGTSISPPAIDGLATSDRRYDGTVRVVPMMHRPTAGWGRLSDDAIAYIRESQEELIGCLEHLAGREPIVIIGEGFTGTIDTARVAAVGATDPELQAAADGFGLAAFIVKHPDIPVIGGDVPSDIQEMQHLIMGASAEVRGAQKVFNLLQEFRNRHALQVAVHAGRSLDRTPTLVFGLHHAEGIAHAARKLGANVAITLIPTVAAACEHMFEPDSPLRQQ